MNYEVLMREALALARRGRGRVEPNPRVGALALRDGEVVGRGFHAFYGGDHAEVAALRDAASGGGEVDTLVVTLEPCSSELGEGGKKTPPCTDALLRAGVKNVVVGVADPDARHRTRGVARLRDQGVEVKLGVLEEECRALNRPFDRWLGMDRPWVIAKWAMSLDGKTATPTGRSRWISGEAARTRVHEVRAQCDGVVVGFRTAVVDDPELTVRHVDGDNPARIVVDPAAELPRTAKLVRTARETPTLVIVAADAADDRVRALRDQGVDVVLAPGDAATHRLDLDTAWKELRRRGMRRLLFEGGGGLAAQLFAAGLISQAMVFVAAKILGGRDAPTPVEGVGVQAVEDGQVFGETFHETLAEDFLLHAFTV